MPPTAKQHTAQQPATLKALSLWQPWASCVAVGAKRIETRSWETLYRGPLLIHAAKRRSTSWLDYSATHNAICDAMRRAGHDWWKTIPYGSIIAICNLARCVRMDEVPAKGKFRRYFGSSMATWMESHLGDFSNGRFAWYLDDVRAFKQPIPYKGARGLFNVPYSAVADQLDSISVHPRPSAADSLHGGSNRR